ncbi:methyltransferase domain-containing protein [Jatrophihabitans sp. YIM 134969]
MAADPSVFDGRLAEWAAYQQTPWGRIRYAVVAHTLDVVVGDARGLRVLDVGGGDGRDALHLAGRGHDVTVLDPSAALLDQANAAATAAGCNDRLTTVEAGIDDLRTLDLGEFDLVLCHNVLQYREDLRRSVGAVVAMADSGALISLLSPNPAAEVLGGVVRGGDPAAALASLDDPTGRSETFDHQVARIDVDAAHSALVGAGCELVHRFGIRCVTDYVRDDARKADPDYFAALADLEIALCDREPYLRTARFWQLVGRSF